MVEPTVLKDISAVVSAVGLLFPVAAFHFSAFPHSLSPHQTLFSHLYSLFSFISYPCCPFSSACVFCQHPILSSILPSQRTPVRFEWNRTMPGNGCALTWAIYREDLLWCHDSCDLLVAQWIILLSGLGHKWWGNARSEFTDLYSSPLRVPV